MKYFLMSGRIDTEMLEKFIPFYNENKEYPCRIILNTRGGDSLISETIIFMINEMEDVGIIIQAVYSAGLQIAVMTKCEKILSSISRGMWHYGRTEISMSVKSVPYYHEDECTMRNLPIERKQADSLARKIMTKKELKDFKADKDVYFDFGRMRQIFPTAKIIK